MRIIAKIVLPVLLMAMSAMASAARYNISVQGVVLDNAGGKLDGVGLHVGDTIQYTEVDMAQNKDTNPAAGAYSGKEYGQVSFNFIVQVVGTSTITTTGSTTWVASGLLDLTQTAPGLYLPFTVTVTGTGMTPDQPLPNFSSVTGGGIVVDMSAQTGVPGDQVVTTVTGVTITAAPLAPNDVNNDGISDVWQRDLSGGNWETYVFMGGAIVPGYNNLPVGLMDPSLSNDFLANMNANNDGMNDILTRNPSTGVWNLSLTNMTTVAYEYTLPMTTDTNWQFQGVGDFDGDGLQDVLVRHKNLGYWCIYYFKTGAANSGQNGTVGGLSCSTSLFLSPDLVYQGAGDITGDGVDEIVIRSASTGQWYIFNPATGTGVVPAGLYKSTLWQFQGLVDLDGDGRKDIVLRITNPSNAYAGLWGGFMMNSSLAVTGVYKLNNLPRDLNEGLAQVGDFDGNGTDDLLLVNSSTGVSSCYTTNASDGQPTLASNPALDVSPWVVLK